MFRALFRRECCLNQRGPAVFFSCAEHTKPQERLFFHEDAVGLAAEETLQCRWSPKALSIAQDLACSVRPLAKIHTGSCWNSCRKIFVGGSLLAGGHVSCVSCKESEAGRAAQPSASLWGFPLGNISRLKHRMGCARILLMNSCSWHVMVAINYYAVEWHPYSQWLLWQTRHRGSQRVFLHIGGDRRRVQLTDYFLLWSAMVLLWNLLPNLEFPLFLF